MTPHFCVPDMLESVMVIEFSPSMHAASEPVAESVQFVTVKVPVQYMQGDPVPAVVPWQFVAFTFGASASL